MVQGVEEQLGVTAGVGPGGADAVDLGDQVGVEHLVGRAGADDAPGVEEDEVVAVAGGEVEVVEDDDRVRAMAVDALRELGYSVIEMRGPREALAAIRGGRIPSLLFTDVVMPEMSGRELVEEVKALRPDLKVLYTTGYTRNAIVHNGTIDFGTELLSKPYTIEELAGKVRTILDR